MSTSMVVRKSVLFSKAKLKTDIFKRRKTNSCKTENSIKGPVGSKYKSCRCQFEDCWISNRYLSDFLSNTDSFVLF